MDKTIIYITLQKAEAKTKTKKKKGRLEELFGRRVTRKKHRFQVDITRNTALLEECEVVVVVWNLEELKEIPDFSELALKEIKKISKVERDLGKEVVLLLAPVLAEELNYYPEEYPLELIQAIYKILPFSDTICIKEGRGNVSPYFVEEIAEQCNQMTILLQEETDYARWEELSERIYDNTGLLVKIVWKLPELLVLEKDRWRKRYPAIFWDFSDSEQIEYRKLGENSFYVDFYPTKKKRRILEAKRTDVTYLSYANILDGMPKIRYNTEVTRTK